MSANGFPDLAVGVLVSGLRLFSMTPHQTPLSSPTMPSSSRSEKLLRDALLRDERERQHLSSPPLPTRPPTNRRRHSHVPTSSHFPHSSEDFARGSFLFRSAMSNPRSSSPSSSSFSQGNEQERDRESSPIGRTLFYGDEDAINAHTYQLQQQQQQSTTSYRRLSLSPNTRTRRRSSPSTSPSPSPLRMKRSQNGLGPDTHSTINPSPMSDTNLRRNQSLQNTTHSRYGSAYPSPSHGQTDQVLRARLEKALTAGGSDNGDSHIMVRRRDGNEVRDEQGGSPWKRGRQNIRSATGSVISASFNTNSSNSNSSHSHPQSQTKYPQIPQIQTRPYNPASTPTRAQTAISNNQRSPYYSPSSPYTPYSAPGIETVPPGSPSSIRTRSQTDPNPPLASPNVISPRRNNSSPTAFPPVAGCGKLTGSNLKPLLVEEELRLPTPPPSPLVMARASLGSATANPTPNATLPVHTQPQRKEAGLAMGIPTQGPAAAVIRKGQEEALSLLEFSSRQRRRDATITQQSHQALRSPTGPKKSNNNADGHSLASSESGSTGTSVSSISHLHVGSTYSASSSSLDGHVGAPPHPPPPHLSNGHHHAVLQSHSTPPSPNPQFNARKASTQCRAIQGYVSFASVEGLGEPPLVGDEFDGDGFGEDVRGNAGKGRKGSVPFLPLGVLNAALGWKKFLGGIGHGVEGQEGVVV